MARHVFSGALACERGASDHRFSFVRTWGDLGHLECDCGETIGGVVEESRWRDHLVLLQIERRARDRELMQSGARAAWKAPRIIARPGGVVPLEPAPRAVLQPQPLPEEPKPRWLRGEARDARNRRIVDAIARGESRAEVAKREGVHPTRISQILAGMRSATGSGASSKGAQCEVPAVETVESRMRTAP